MLTSWWSWRKKQGINEIYLYMVFQSLSCRTAPVVKPCCATLQWLTLPLFPAVMFSLQFSSQWKSCIYSAFLCFPVSKALCVCSPPCFCERKDWNVFETSVSMTTCWWQRDPCPWGNNKHFLFTTVKIFTDYAVTPGRPTVSIHPSIHPINKIRDNSLK